MKFISFLLLSFSLKLVVAQPAHYTVANAHSHNDYEQSKPFWKAYNAGFGSIEADIFLINDQLLVAHEEKELNDKRTLESLYLRPLKSCIEKQKGFVYADTGRCLQLLIDIKTDSIATLNKLIEVLQEYPTLINNPSLKIVITGGRPVAEDFPKYPPYILFDGNVGTTYNKASMEKIAMLSASLKDFTEWTGTGSLSTKDKALLKSEINKAHELNKPIRFWEAPDLPNAWGQLMKLKVDFINTDHIPELSAFLR